MSDAEIIKSILPLRAINALAMHGIRSVEQIKANYPHGLLRARGFGMQSLRAVESAFFPGQSYDPNYRVPLSSRGASNISELLAQDLESVNVGNFTDLQ